MKKKVNFFYKNFNLKILDLTDISIIIPILCEHNKKKILFLAKFGKDGILTFIDSDEIMMTYKEISKLYNIHENAAFV